MQRFIDLIANSAYAIRMIHKVDSKRVFAAGVKKMLYYFEWLFYSGIFMRVIIYGIENRFSFYILGLFILLTLSISCGINWFNCWYDAKLLLLSNLKIYEKLYGVIFEKAAKVDIKCYDNEEFYNNYILALDNADEKICTIIDNIWNVVFGFIAVCVACVLLAKIDAGACVFALGPLIGNYVIGNSLNRIIFSHYKEALPMHRFLNYVNRVIYLSDYAKEIRVTNILKVLIEKYDRAVLDIHKLIDKYALKRIALDFVYLILTFTVMFEGVMFYGAWIAITRKTISLSQMSILCSLMVAVSWMCIGISKAYIEIIKSGTFLEGFKLFWDYRADIPEDSEGISINDFQEIEFRNVSFSYKGKKVVDRLCMKLEKGKKYALVGYNGAGKSTILNLLLRFYDPDEGIITCDGLDIKTLNLREYRKLFSTILQDDKIFAATIKENLYLNKCENLNQDHYAIENSELFTVLQNMPDKINTYLTKEFKDDGTNLSGGQEQKLFFARAYLNNSPAFVFDEPTSKLDPIAESTLFEKMMGVSQNRLLILVSHRLSNMHGMDYIFYLEDGVIKERGNHESLMLLNGQYAKMYQIQARNYREMLK